MRGAGRKAPPSGANSSPPVKPISRRIIAIPVMRNAERRRLAIICSHMLMSETSDVDSAHNLTLSLSGEETRAELEFDLRRGAFVLGFDLEELAAAEVEHVAIRFCREDLDVRVVGHHGIVVELAGEGHFVFGRGEFFL